MLRHPVGRVLVVLAALAAVSAVVLFSLSDPLLEPVTASEAAGEPVPPAAPERAAAPAPRPPVVKPTLPSPSPERQASAPVLERAPQANSHDDGRTQEELATASRDALARSIERRRAAAERAETDPVEKERILTAIHRNREKLGVTTPVDELFRLLKTEYKAATEADFCEVQPEPPPECASAKETLAQVQQEFQQKAGYSVQEFRRGHRNTPPPLVSMPPRNE